MVIPVLAVFEVLDLITAEEHRELVKYGDKSIEALQYVHWVVGLWPCQCQVDMYAFAVVGMEQPYSLGQDATPVTACKHTTSP